MAYKVLEVNVDDIGNGGVYSLIKSVIEHKPKDITIDIATIEHFENEDNIYYLNKLGTKVKYIGFSGNKVKKQFVVYKNLLNYLKHNHYDCVHIHSDVANKYLASGFAAKKAGVKKIIVHSHSSGIDGTNSRKKEIFHKVARNFLNLFATDYVACSDVAAQWMFTKAELEKVKIINNGIDLKRFKYNPELRKKVRSKLGIQESELLLGHVGRFTYQKNHEYLIEIFKQVTKKQNNMKLLLVGEGPNEENIKKLVRQYKLEDKVIFYGLSKHVDQLLQAMDIFVLPSRFEGLPIVGVEAQAAGLPVIFSDKITRSAKLISTTKFLPLHKNSISTWTNEIINFKKYKRDNAYKILEKQHFDISDTVDGFLILYKK